YNDSWWSPDEFTTSLWVKSEVNQSPSNAFIIKPVGSISNRWELSYHDAERLAFYMYNGSAASSLVAYKVLLADGKWHHIALKFKANETQEIWVDGTRVASKKPSFDTGLGSTDRELRLGGRGWWLQNNIYFQGYFDDFRLYKRALSDDEIIYLSTMYPKQVNSTLPISRYNDFYFSTMYDRKMLKWKIKDTSHNARWNTYSHVLVPVFGDNLSEQYSFKLNTTYGDVKFITDPDWNVIFFDYNNFSATDVHVYDTNGNTNYTCTNLSYCGWSLVNYTWHNFTGDIVVDNGIIRLVLRPGVQSSQNKLLYWNGTSWYQFYQYFPYYASGTPGVYNITKLSSDEVEVVFFVNDTDGSEANRYQHTNDSFIIKRGYPAIFKKVVPYPDSENLYYDEFFRITSSSQSCVKFGYKYNHINLYPTNDVSIWGDHSQTYLAFCNESGALFIVSHRNDTSGVLYHSTYIMTAAGQPNNTDWYWVDFVLPFNVTNLLHQAEDFTHPSSVYIIDEPNASFDKALYYNQSAGWSYKTVRLEKGQYLIFYRLSVNDTTASQPLTIIANSSNVNYNKTVLPSDASNFPTYNYIYLNVSLDSNDNLSIGVLGEGIDASWYVDAVVIIPVSDGSSFPLDISQALLYVLDLNYSDAPTPTDPWFSPPNKILETFSDGDVHDYSPFYWNENGNWYLSDVYKGNGLSIVNTSIN
ncbi:MAG TPA: LamG domain-containing protein, partial [Candidatus Aenigmarchaeota archaeon]|nr:LamG domain-containing protein [Candidatus Aenigmarchaeota archaeon]HEX33066.1 LamG domain-containing protein [Candidatus Aenigmarchaeota archaeon]